jgi:hypothetical protein
MKPDSILVPAIPLFVYSADQGSKASFKFSRDNSALFCKGVSIDNISYITGTVDELSLFTARLDDSSAPPELIQVATSRYGEALDFELGNLCFANQCPSGEDSVFSSVSLLRKLQRAGRVEPEYDVRVNAMAVVMESIVSARAAIISETGYIGLVPEYAQIDDVVCVLFGSQVPVVLRKDGDHYRFVGEWYVISL